MDPLSLAASVAGLISLVSSVAKLTLELRDQIKQKPELLRRLALELGSFEPVLVDLRGHLEQNDRYRRPSCHVQGDDSKALKAVLVSCDETARDLYGRLESLRELSSKGLLGRLSSRSKIAATMADVGGLRESLAAFKLTLSIAVQLRVLTNLETKQLTTRGDFDLLRTEVKTTAALTQKSLAAAASHPIQQYIDITASMLPRDSPVASETSTSPSSTPAVSGDEVSNHVASFASFSDWLDSFQPSPENESPVLTLNTPEASPQAAMATSSNIRNSRVKVRVTSLGPWEECETVEAAMTDYLFDVINALRQRGYSTVCGFRMGKKLLSPVEEFDKFLPVYVTDGPSSYSLDCLEINKDQPLNEFYDKVISGGQETDGLGFDLQNDEIVTSHRGPTGTTTLRVSFNRTMKLPEDGVIYPLPAIFNKFPLCHVGSQEYKFPPAITAKGGLGFPMYAREAVSLGFHSHHEYDLTTYHPGAGYYPGVGETRGLAVRVLCGGINVLTGLAENQEENSSAQGHILTSEQTRLDGYLWAPKNGRSIVRQFVTMPTGHGYSPEYQLTQSEGINGIQVVICPPFAGPGDFSTDATSGPAPVKSQQSSPAQLGIAVGKRLRMAGKELTSRHDFEHMLSDTVEHYFCVRQPPYRKGYRPVRVHEVLFSCLEKVNEGYEITLEPLFAMKITVLGPEDMRFTLELSPFLPVEFLHPIVDDFALEYRNKFPPKPFFYTTKLCLGGKRIPASGRLLHEICNTGDVLQLLVQEPHRTDSGVGKMWQSASGGQSPLVSGWEMGVAAGGLMYQDVRVDRYPHAWNWKRAKLINVQIINAVAFESFTGRPPPAHPFSFATYINAGIPFYHLLPEAGVVSSEVLSSLESVSQRDSALGVIKSTEIQGMKPVECAMCEQMLTDTILRPCNHVFCSDCVRSNMLTRGRTLCRACWRVSTHQIQFAAPMERPRLPILERKPVSHLEIETVSGGSSHSALLDPMPLKPTVAPRASTAAECSLSPLQLAAGQNNVDVVLFFLRNTSPDLDERLEAIKIAATAGHLEVLRCLTQQPSPSPNHPDGAVIDAAIESGKVSVSMSMVATAAHGNTEIFKVLLPLLSAEDRNATAWKASRAGNSELLAILLNAGVSANLRYPAHNDPPLLWFAAADGEPRTLSLLLANGADVSGRYCPTPPASDTVTQSRSRTVPYSPMESFSLVDSRPSWGSSSHAPSDLRGSDWSTELPRWSLSTSSTALHQAVAGGHLEAFDILVAAGADLQERLGNSQTCLHVAAMSGNVEIMRRLLDAGLAISTDDSDAYQSVQDESLDASYFDLMYNGPEFSDSKDVYWLLKSRKIRRTPLVEAVFAITPSPDLLELLLARGNTDVGEKEDLVLLNILYKRYARYWADDAATLEIRPLITRCVAVLLSHLNPYVKGAPNDGNDKRMMRYQSLIHHSRSFVLMAAGLASVGESDSGSFLAEIRAIATAFPPLVRGPGALKFAERMLWRAKSWGLQFIDGIMGLFDEEVLGDLGDELQRAICEGRVERLEDHCLWVGVIDCLRAAEYVARKFARLEVEHGDEESGGNKPTEGQEPVSAAAAQSGTDVGVEKKHEETERDKAKPSPSP